MCTYVVWAIIALFALKWIPQHRDEVSQIQQWSNTTLPWLLDYRLHWMIVLKYISAKLWWSSSKFEAAILSNFFSWGLLFREKKPHQSSTCNRAAAPAASSAAPAASPKIKAFRCTLWLWLIISELLKKSLLDQLPYFSCCSCCWVQRSRHCGAVAISESCTSSWSTLD